jgi:hypothetical protein
VWALSVFRLRFSPKVGDTLNLTGLYLGLFMLFAIGFGFFWVIKVEYYLGARVWKIVLGIGVLLCLASLFMPGFTLAALLGIIGGSVVWGATELPGQAERVRRGLFPANPKRNSEE